MEYRAWAQSLRDVAGSRNSAIVTLREKKWLAYTPGSLHGPFPVDPDEVLSALGVGGVFRDVVIPDRMPGIVSGLPPFMTVKQARRRDRRSGNFLLRSRAVRREDLPLRFLS